MCNCRSKLNCNSYGRVICQSHSKYPNFIQPNKTDFEDEQMEKELTCLTCSHYENDDCYFPKSEIDRIEFDRLNRSRFQCNLCGNKIDLMLTIVQKIYFEVKFNMKMPLICCFCYEGLKKNYFDVFFAIRIFLSLIFYLPIISIIRFSMIGALGYVAFIIVIKIIIKHNTHQSFFLMDLIKGKKFYDKNFKGKIESS